MRGVMGPIEIFEGPYGLFESVTGPFNINWENRSLEKMLGVSVKKYIAGVHSQTAIEGVSELQAENTIERWECFLRCWAVVRLCCQVPYQPSPTDHLLRFAMPMNLDQYFQG